MASLTPDLSATPAVLTVELDINTVADGARPPAPLSRQQAERLGDAVAADLRRILGEELSEFGLISVGALYDLTEILQPGLPFIEVLLELYRGSLPAEGFRPQLVAIGSEGERFPVEAIAPRRQPGAGPLLAVPFLLVGPADAVDALQSKLENLLLEKGVADIATERSLREDFRINPVNLSYATINDLCALLKIQLEHNELGSLWTLLESALYRPGERTRVQLPGGNRFFLDGADVYSPFYTFDQWVAQYGRDSDHVAGYSEWTMRQRQYMAGLAAHGLRVHWTEAESSLADACENRGLETARQHLLVDQERVREATAPVGELAGASIILLTEQATRTLGAVAYTVLVQAASGEVLYLGNEYPLHPRAIHAIRDEWAQRAEALGVEIHIARGDRLMLSEDGRHLVPDLDTVGGPH